ncbi:MAG: hypothetical protein JJU29_23995 [Verrucomicrobia bacterium]|nr:hypothetical protein [Verrucomicrobiota bacterium]
MTRFWYTLCTKCNKLHPEDANLVELAYGKGEIKDCKYGLCPKCSGDARRDNATPDRTADKGCSVEGMVDQNSEES